MSASLVDYKGLQVVDPAPTGAGGLAIQDNFKKLIDWQYAVIDDSLTSPPGSPTVGDRYIVASPATGDWAGLENQIVECTSASPDPVVWSNLVPNVGFPVFVASKQLLYYWDGTAWQPIASGTGALAQVFDAYDAAGGQTFTSATITVNLDTVRKNSDANIFSIAADELTIDEAGTYILAFRVSTDISSGTARSSSKCWLEVDTGGGFAEVTGSRGYMYNRIDTVGENTATVQLALDVSAGDKFRVRANRVAGSDTLATIANASGLSAYKFGTPGLVGTAGDPAGADTQVQFNNAGVFGADPSFTYDSGASALQVDNISIDGNTVSATDTNGNLILSPNGNGALQADAAGDPRGTLAVDLQSSRFAANQVASGVYSAIGGGRRNAASGAWSTVSGGYGNTVIGYGSTVGGGFSNTASGYYGTVGGGGGIVFGNTANGNYSTISGGYGNTASDYGSIIGGGNFNAASGQFSTIPGGRSSKAGGAANADYTSILGGNTNWAGGVGATVGGGVAHNTNAASIVNQTTGAVTGTTTEVVAGKFSTIAGGQKNTASGTNSTVGGGQGNTASNYHGTVSGGHLNTAGGFYGTVGGGSNNIASGDYVAIGGGSLNIASGFFSTVGGGSNNTAYGGTGTIGGGDSNIVSGSYVTIGGGRYNLTSGAYSTVSGGNLNQAGGAANADYTSILGGNTNWAGGVGATIGGGVAHNTNAASVVNQTTGVVTGTTTEVVAGKFSTIAGGQKNTATGGNSTVSGGQGNTASGYSCTVSGGYYNTASSSYATVTGGHYNTASQYWSTVGGGSGNQAINSYSTVGGGGYNSASGDSSSVSGGYLNFATALSSTVGGGYSNSANGNYAVVTGGDSSQAIGNYAVVAGGKSNVASGDYSAIPGGNWAQADKYGQFTHASGRFAADGDAQASTLIARNSTTDATATNLFLNGSSSRLTIPTDTAWVFFIDIVATQQGMANIKKFQRAGVIVNDAGTTSISSIDTIGTDSTIGSPGAWTVAITADNTNDALDISVTGAAATNIRWVARITLTEVSYPA